MTGPATSSRSGLRTEATIAALNARIRIRELAGIDEIGEAERFFARIRAREGNPSVSRELLRAVSDGGGYLGGAYAGRVLIGATLGFHAAPDRRLLCSYITGRDPEFTSCSIGFAMKLHERAWAAERDIAAVEWTFDPLVGRDAHLYLGKLGAAPMAYLEHLHDDVSGDTSMGRDETDRLLVRWDVLEPAATAARDGDDSLTDNSNETWSFVPVPEDIVSLRSIDPEGAHRWRLALREQLAEHRNAGDRIAGFDRARGYILRKGYAT
ncbi:hypothetical protein [Diaminobutyricibacter sp. McL0608]|uniref:hypothetical protein n=1 Tax=Leifsonia sp. McL0608 TaxID=3143537 RepID=UPI0031F334BE